MQRLGSNCAALGALFARWDLYDSLASAAISVLGRQQFSPMNADFGSWCKLAQNSIAVFLNKSVFAAQLHPKQFVLFPNAARRRRHMRFYCCALLLLCAAALPGLQMPSKKKLGKHLDRVRPSAAVVPVPVAGAAGADAADNGGGLAASGGEAEDEPLQPPPQLQPPQPPAPPQPGALGAAAEAAGQSLICLSIRNMRWNIRTYFRPRRLLRVRFV